MSTQDTAALIESVNKMTDTVAGKMGEIDQRMNNAERGFESFKTNVKRLIPAINLLPDPGFQLASLGAGVPSPYTLANLYGAVSTIEVVELTDQDKNELAVVLGNGNAFKPKSGGAFWPSTLLPRKVVITQTVAGAVSSAIRFQCNAMHVMGKPLYMSLVKMGAFTKKSGDVWQFGPVDGMYINGGDIDDNRAFSVFMNGVTVWEIFLPFLTFESNEMVYSNIGGNQ